MRKYIYLLLLALNIATDCYCQIHSKVMYIMKVTYIPLQVEFDGNTTAYAIIDTTTFNALPNYSDPNILPGIIYFLTKNGGYYAVDDTMELASRICCLTGDMKFNMNSYVYNSYLHNESAYDWTKEFGGELFEDLKTNNRNTLIINAKLTERIENYTYKENGIYRISFWKAELDYCVCDVFDTQIDQPNFGNKCAYIRRVDKSLHIKNSERKAIRSKLKSIIESVK